MVEKRKSEGCDTDAPFVLEGAGFSSGLFWLGWLRLYGYVEFVQCWVKSTSCLENFIDLLNRVIRTTGYNTDFLAAPQYLL